LTEHLPSAFDRSDDVALRREINAEQTYLDGAYARLDAMRHAASRVAETYAEVQRGGTHQARLERDVAINNTTRRLAALDIGDAPLCFGRIDLERDDDNRFYVGRIAVDDEEHLPLVVDWRAPVAEPFYRATAVEPMGIVRRRHFHIRGRELFGLDDEVFDADATDDAGFTVVGEGALFAALDRHRTGRMNDIVATIQLEQDEAIRSDLSGVLIVAGGPGTGKTAVALHRAAYLLYTYRRKLESSGVLLVGPNAVFLRYIDQVLPSLGENDVHLATISSLRGGVPVRALDPPSLAALKGDPRMGPLLGRALRDRERPLPKDLVVALDGVVLRLRRRDTARIIERVRHRRGTHNVRRAQLVRFVMDHLVGEFRRGARRSQEQYHDSLRRGEMQRDELQYEANQRGEMQFDFNAMENDPEPDLREIAAIAEETDAELAKRIRRIPEVREALERMWPVLSGAELLHDLFSFRELIASAAGGQLSLAEQQSLYRPRAASVADVHWTENDIPLIDEADALLGPIEAARPRRRRLRPAALDDATAVVEDFGLGGMMSATSIAERYYGHRNNDPDAVPELRTYGHVLVDEAQDLSAMQWRMLARRCPTASMTIVGDFGQASRPGALRDWSQVISAIDPRAGASSARTVTLSVNYRTPSEVMDVANQVLAVAAPHVHPARSVRTTGELPRFVKVLPEVLVREGASAGRNALNDSGGTVAVIVPAALRASMVAALSDVGASASVTDALEAPIAVLAAADAKGLEFDHVVVVEPSQLVPTDQAGLRLLYVTLTRPTRTLTVVHARPLPEGLRTAVVS
jgi:DNA helicase IV